MSMVALYLAFALTFLAATPERPGRFRSTPEPPPEPLLAMEGVWEGWFGSNTNPSYIVVIDTTETGRIAVWMDLDSTAWYVGDMTFADGVWIEDYRDKPTSCYSWRWTAVGKEWHGKDGWSLKRAAK